MTNRVKPERADTSARLFTHLRTRCHCNSAAAAVWSRPRLGLLDDGSDADWDGGRGDPLQGFVPQAQAASPAVILAGLADLVPSPLPAAGDEPTQRAPVARREAPPSPSAVGRGYTNYLERLDVPINDKVSKVLPFADDRISANVQSFFDEARSRGIDLKLNAGFRTNGLQAKETGNALGGVPYNSSKHEAGYAFDVNWK